MKLICIRDEEAVNLDIWRFMKFRKLTSYHSLYDQRRVKRARRKLGRILSRLPKVIPYTGYLTRCTFPQA